MDIQSLIADNVLASSKFAQFSAYHERIFTAGNLMVARDILNEMKIQTMEQEIENLKKEIEKKNGELEFLR